MTEHNDNPTVAAIVEAIEQRLGWRATAEACRIIAKGVLGALLGRGEGHLGSRTPDRVWARPTQGKGGVPGVAVTAFWGDHSVYIAMPAAK